jgi:ribosomal-protein-alanine N-acetyltransferase
LFIYLWGKGIAPLAIEKFFKVAFKDLGLHRLQAGIEPHNKRSLSVARKLKMRREGISKRVVYLRGEWQDLVQFAITSEDVGIRWKGNSKKDY